MSKMTLMPKKDLEELLIAQKEMDQLVLDNNDPIEDSERFMCILLASLSEVFETANEIETFKFWKKQRNKRNFLEESVDTLHFLLSLINQIEAKHGKKTQLHKAITISNEGLFPNENQLLLFITRAIAYLDFEDEEYIHEGIRNALKGLLMLQRVRGYEWEDVKEAYYKKHAINIQRQKENY